MRNVCLADTCGDHNSGSGWLNNDEAGQRLYRVWPSVGVFVCYSAALAGLTFTLKYIELSIAYAIWAGAGTALIAVIGMIYFREPVTALKLVSLGFVIIGVVGLQLSSGDVGG